ncbi:MAG: twin-arginine translocase TatA/TatE family subunit [Robiginitomaculum sp.]
MFASPWQLLVVGVLVLVLFGGKGKISNIMGDVAKGITSFRKGLKEDPDASPADAAEDAIDVTPPKETKDKK